MPADGQIIGLKLTPFYQLKTTTVKTQLQDSQQAQSYSNELLQKYSNNVYKY